MAKTNLVLWIYFTLSVLQVTFPTDRDKLSQNKKPGEAHYPVNLESNEDESRYAVVRKLGGLFQIFVWRNISGAD
jgi:hypothetical protein